MNSVSSVQEVKDTAESIMWPLQSSGFNSLFTSLVLFLTFASFAVASAPASFCKCTCFSNSTIIPLDPPKPESSSFAGNLARDIADLVATDNEKRANSYQALSCNDCNRKFCLGYDLPVCKGAKEDDVVSTCFQRDSRKDEAIVFIFIFATSGLLACALFRPWVQKWLEAARERRQYIPVAEPGD
ncbi:uncharacterized protein ACHE_60703S [Aspergillus chevalieri]|uniref:Uncharacterized protein n=1 Tax=Aspergillus chevalieri TaxID=182096 RepID=A0A7R7VU55_ASPCH|nr:uncharacterized protein ACHE_60703S [Aspergillus chevalieri]BCR90817.1 hypothetical protein ACHE_60703S [Aspergillus chevalieri]